MKKNVFKKTALSGLRAYIIPIVFTVAMIAMIVYGLSETERSSKSEGIRVLEESIRRAAVTCYAIEGSYPSDISYIEENYGVHIDRSKYAVYYVIFASNLLPDISVVELK